jgi:glycosyltransferase involved in cell wall biosynthesis
VKRIAIFIANYAFGTSSSVINTVRMLAGAGYGVDIFLYRVAHPDQVVFQQNSIKIFNLSDEVLNPERPTKSYYLIETIRRATKRLPRLVDRIRSASPQKMPENGVIPTPVVHKIREIIAPESYCCYIGVEAGGLIMAGLARGTTQLPLIYFSLELYLDDDPRFQNEYYKNVRHYEQKFHQQAVATIIQDEERAEILKEHNRIDGKQPVFFVPVSLLGHPVRTRSRYFYDKFNIPPHKKILLSIGGIERNRLSLDVALASRNLPEDFVIVQHGYTWDSEKEYFQKVRALAVKSDRLFLSLNMVNFDRIPELVSSAYVGLVFYRFLSKNEEHTGAASGKLAHYFQCGLPVIGPDLRSIGRILEKYDCGVGVDDPSEIPQALNKIVSRYEVMRANAFRCYNEQYEFSRHFSQVLNFIGKGCR